MDCRSFYDTSLEMSVLRGATRNRGRRHHTSSHVSPPMIDPHTLFDQQQHPVCSKRLTLRLIIVAGKKKKSKKAKVYPFHIVGSLDLLDGN